MASDIHPLKMMKGLVGAVLGAVIWLIASSKLLIPYGPGPVMALINLLLGMGLGAVAVGTIFGSSGKPRRKALIGALLGSVAAIIAMVVGLVDYSASRLIALAALWALIGAFLFSIIYKR